MDNFDEYQDSKKFDIKEWSTILEFVKPYKFYMIVLLAAAVFTAFFDALFPMMTKYAISTFIQHKTTNGLWIFALVFVSFALIQAVGSIIYSKSAMYIEMNVGKDMKYTLFAHTQNLSLDYFNQTPVGYILTRIMLDTNSLGSIFSWIISGLAFNSSYVLFALINMFSLNVKLTVAFIFVLPLLYVTASHFQTKQLKQNRIVRKKNSVVTGGYNEHITGAVTIKELNIKDKINQEFKEESLELYNETLKLKAIDAVFMPIIMNMSGLIVAVILGYGSKLYFSNELNVADLAVFISYAFMLVFPFEQLIKGLSMIIALQANVERINGLLERSPLVKDSADIEKVYGDIYDANKENWEEMKGDIEFKNVSFKYPDSDIYVLENFNLTIKAGTSVAIVGHTGAGKSTLVNLVCRFFEPTSGEILIDGVDYRKRSLLWLQTKLSYVLQTPHLFSGTIEENIRYANQDATMEEIIEAAKQAQADKFIQKLPNGYKTQVGQGGDKLSTGQKQLISIARAILANGRILVMDEATSSVDTQTEQLINAMTFDLMANRTSFIIAHRLSTVKNADIILVVENGKIIEMGNHSQLLRKEGHYYELYTGQWEESEQADFFEKLHSKG